MEKLPIELGKSPLLDAVIEIRFETDIEKSAIFGMIYGKIKKDYQGTVLTTAEGEYPLNIRESNPNLKYKPTHQIISNSYIIAIGCNVIGLIVKDKYLGWRQFSEDFLKIFTQIREEDGLISRVTRLGLRYANYFENKSLHDKCFNIQFRQSNEKNIFIKYDIEKDDVINTVQFLENYQDNRKKNAGAVLDIDTFINYENAAFSENVNNEIEKVHKNGKALFFKLLTQDLIKTLEPKYE